MHHHHALLALLGTTALSEAIALSSTFPRATESVTPLTVAPLHKISAALNVRTTASDAEMTDLVAAGGFTARNINKRSKDSGIIGFCGPLGISCGSIDGDTSDSANAVDAKRDADPQGLSFCGPPGVSCGQGDRRVKERDVIDKASSQREAIQDSGVIGFCGPLGMSCADGIKRESSPITKPESKPEADGVVGFCGPPGISCGSGEKRGANANAHNGGPVGFCGEPGVICARGGDQNSDGEGLLASESDGSSALSSASSEQALKRFVTIASSQPVSDVLRRQMVEDKKNSFESNANRTPLLVSGLVFAMIMIALQFFMMVIL